MFDLYVAKWYSSLAPHMPHWTLPGVIPVYMVRSNNPLSIFGGDPQIYKKIFVWLKLSFEIASGVIPRSKFCEADSLFKTICYKVWVNIVLIIVGLYCACLLKALAFYHIVMYTCGFISVSIFMGCKSKIIYMNLVIPVFSIESFEDQELLGDKKCLGNLPLIHFSFSQSTFPIDLSEYWAFYPVLLTEFGGEEY